MDQIRFDFLGGITGSGNSRNASTASTEPSDAFAQILDQQLTRKAEAAAAQRTADQRSIDRRSTDSRSRSDASDRTDSDRTQALRRRDDRRDSKTTATAQSSVKSDAASSKSTLKAKQPEKAATDGKAKPAAKTQKDATDDKAEAAAGGQTTTDSAGANGSTKTESKPGASGDGTQQQGDSSQQPADDGSDQGEKAAETDPSLLAIAPISLPLQTVTGAAGASTDLTASTGNGKTAAALQAELAASLAGSSDPKAPVAGAPGSQMATGGLKFGAILKGATGQQQQQKAATDAALQDATEGTTDPNDPLALANAATTKAKDAKTGADAPAKQLHGAAQSNATAAAKSETGKATASIVQPMTRSAAVTWSGTNVHNEIADSLVAGVDGGLAADDTEFSNWSQYLGANASGLSSATAARQSAFMAQLRQNMQVLPPHEQIAVQIQNAMQNGNSRVTVALHPAELGRVEVKLNIDKDKHVTATVVVDRPATLDLLQRDAKALERALQDAGLQADSGSLSFNLRDSGGQGGGTAQNGAGTGGGAAGVSGGTDAKTEATRAGVVAIADGYVDLET